MNKVSVKCGTFLEIFKWRKIVLFLKKYLENVWSKKKKRIRDIFIKKNIGFSIVEKITQNIWGKMYKMIQIASEILCMHKSQHVVNLEL